VETAAIVPESAPQSPQSRINRDNGDIAAPAAYETGAPLAGTNQQLECPLRRPRYSYA
jgi:hypothetical protein